MNTARVLALVLLISLVVGLGGCASSWTARDVTPESKETANVLLYLSNQSSARPAVTMSVYVDGQLALRRNQRDVMAGGQHGFPDEYKLRLPPGPHTIRVVAEGRKASATAEIVVGSGMVYVDAAYFCPNTCDGDRSSESITINVGDEPPGFC